MNQIDIYGGVFGCGPFGQLPRVALFIQVMNRTPPPCGFRGGLKAGCKCIKCLAHQAVSVAWILSAKAKSGQQFTNNLGEKKG